MQTVRLLQAVALMLIVAVAASCKATKQYTSKLFAPRTAAEKDSQSLALRFLPTDSNDTDQEGWVTTDIIMGRDTNNTTALDNFAKVFPSSSVVKSPVKDSAKAYNDTIISPPVLVAKPPATAEEKTVARNTPVNGTREKRSREE